MFPMSFKILHGIIYVCIAAGYYPNPHPPKDVCILQFGDTIQTHNHLAMSVLLIGNFWSLGRQTSPSPCIRTPFNLYNLVPSPIDQSRATFLLYYLIRLIFTVVTKLMIMSYVNNLVFFFVNTMFESLSYA